MIARCGMMDASEIECWKGLAAIKTDAQASLILVSVDSSPSLQLQPQSISLPPSTLTSQFMSYTTPVSTPQPSSIVSPDQSGNAPTPPNVSTPNESQSEIKLEPDATLVDITDQTWGAVLPPKLSPSANQLESSPTLATGYLVKRSGAASSDVPVVVGVNLLHTEYNPRLHENLLKDILSLYRALGTLARARGCVDPAKDARPWHIAAAEKGSDILHMLM
jgi:mediator of RNA polymerase II transcription subunit 13